MTRSRWWSGWILLPLGLLLVGITAKWLSMSATGQVLHPNAQAVPSVTQADPSPEWSVAVDRSRRILRSGLAAQNLPGLSVAVGVGGSLLWAEGFGWADLETRAPVTPDTRFRIGTASTVLTSAAAGLLVDKGRLSMDEEIQAYVPQFPRKQWAVTLQQLMANVAGVGTDSGDDGPLYRQRCERPVAALESFMRDPLLFEPGTQCRHSKYGWILVSAAVEAAAGQPLLPFMKEHIFQPLGMDNTGAEAAKVENPEGVGEPGEDAPFLTFFRHVILQPLGLVSPEKRPATQPATLYAPGLGPNPIVQYGLHMMRLGNLSCYAGSMAFFSTPADLVRFGLAIHSGKLLQPATVRSLQASQRLASGQQTGHGLGWDLDTVTLSGQSTEVAGHDGELRGRRVMSLLLFRETGMVVAVMATLPNADTPALGLKVAEAFAQPKGR